MGWQIILIGIAFVALGIMIALLEKFGLPRLPGDILIQRGNFTFYAPFATMLVISAILTILFNLFKR